MAVAHARQAIREAIAKVLSTSPVAWTQVVESRISSPRQIWPYLMVFAESDIAGKISVNLPCIYRRSLSITVVGMLRLPGSGDHSTIEDRMDALAAEVETKLTNTTLRAVTGMTQIESLTLTSTQMDVAIDEDNSIDHAEVQMSFDVAYAVAEGAPAVIL